MSPAQTHRGDLIVRDVGPLIMAAQENKHSRTFILIQRSFSVNFLIN